MSPARFIVADVFTGLATLPDDSVDLVMTSPPYLGLRSYLPADHPDKDKEMGGEPDPASFLDDMLDVVEACERVLAPHGSVAFVIGDTRSGSGGAGGDYAEGGWREGQPKWKQARPVTPHPDSKFGEGREWDHEQPRRATKRDGLYPHPGWPPAKSLSFVPELFGASLAYGRNLLRPERTFEPWRVRQRGTWCKPNPTPGRLGDKFRDGTELMIVACKSGTRYFDLDGVREPPKHGLDPSKPMGNGLYRDHPKEGSSASRPDRVSHPLGAPPLDWWVVATEGYAGSHYAVYPPALILKPMKSMVPPRVCTTCGEPARREQVDEDAEVAVLGQFVDCGHGTFRLGVVLDPFAGSGTTLAVATGLGYDAIGIDIDEDNVGLAMERVGPLLLSTETLMRHET